MFRILVTGADGFLGKEVIEVLKKDNFEFVGVSRKNNRENYLFCDLSIPNDVLKLLEKTEPDIIINLAASIDFKERDIRLFFPVNVLLPAILGNYCKQNHLFFVHSSSITVHGFSHELYNINTEFLPDKGYEKSKLLADNVIAASGCESSILRLGGIYGENGPFHLGINKAIDDAKKRKLPTVVGTGEAKRNYIYVKDAAQAILQCIKERLSGIHYLGGEEKTIRDMLTDICEVLIPGQLPKHMKGGKTKDQIVENSPYFETTSFRTAIEEIV